MRNGACALVALLLAAPLAGQGYRVRLDARWQTAAYRGVRLDSIPVGDTVGTPGGGPASPDGFAVRCIPGAAYCTFFRPGPALRGGPMTTTVDGTIWGLGVAGLSVRGAARVGVDLGTADVWPGTTPTVQLLEGYAEYAAQRVTARLGRQAVASRLGWSGFDGAGITLRDRRRGIDLQGYGGWGLARGVALPVTSPALDPLDDFQPLARQLVVGAGGGWSGAGADVRVDYQREVDPRAHKFVSERVGFDAAVRAIEHVRLAGGADYDIAAGWWGSAEASLTYLSARARGTVAVRRYRPHFDLWTIWGAFSPVPYRSVQLSLAVTALRRFEVRGRYERYRFDDAFAETPLFDVKQDGWRGELGVTATPAPHWTIDAAYQREFGPGAAVSGTAATVTFEPSGRIRAALLASAMNRPLEFRYSDAVVRAYGFDGQYRASERLRITFTTHYYDERRGRPDAGAFDWQQWRASLGLALAFGDGADTRGLPPAIRMLPGGRSAR